ncbi:Prostasin [Amphibalanus amphitrite]|uniref:Prostasin n=1 Tax=Amphibalanus amphitrite TaxID=1232801 RepID=A0A6A4VS41_AMPAM|nr:Prostasin [Amphibalanus amphitrite]
MNLADVPCGVRQVSGRQGRVKGGQEAHRGQFPWSASIHVEHGGHFCMGSVISSRYVLTAAHCFDGRPADKFTVTVGAQDLSSPEPGRVTVSPAEKIVHQGYKAGQFDDDIALLRLDAELAWSDYIQPICLSTEDAKTFVGMRGIIAGWGYLDEWRKGGERSDTLQWTEVPILARQTCQQWFDTANKKVKISQQKLCAGYKTGGKDACQADSGGALTVPLGGQYRLTGVVSAGFGCGRPGCPASTRT